MLNGRRTWSLRSGLLIGKVGGGGGGLGNTPPPPKRQPPGQAEPPGGTSIRGRPYVHARTYTHVERITKSVPSHVWHETCLSNPCANHAKGIEIKIDFCLAVSIAA
jgi:hypothetical protein